ncbi:hypothetical protein AVEN_208498-1 [Araneus ventricosus]|uniref:Uncharacterized protein n=1 Tax=Araneus ventricosus TaxID=182803 RepID=A0A4Y2E562_ARAVE|nr:hypothetical protein AVEN_208498-1 [Araneus ventricosus]
MVCGDNIDDGTNAYIDIKKNQSGPLLPIEQLTAKPYCLYTKTDRGGLQIWSLFSLLRVWRAPGSKTEPTAVCGELAHTEPDDLPPVWHGSLETLCRLKRCSRHLTTVQIDEFCPR